MPYFRDLSILCFAVVTNSGNARAHEVYRLIRVHGQCLGALGCFVATGVEFIDRGATWRLCKWPPTINQSMDLQGKQVPKQLYCPLKSR